MILADKILEHGGELERFAKLCPRLRDAPKYRLDDDVLKACIQVSQAKPSSLMSAIDFCRAPFPTVWLEWSHGGMIRARGLTSEPAAGKILPQSTGMLLELDDECTAGMISLLWDRADNPDVMLSPLAVMCDWSQGRRAVDPNGLRQEMLQTPERFLKERLRLLENEAEMTAMAHVCGLYTNRTHPDHPPMSCTREQAEAFIADWDGEVAFLQAFLIMLNSKNGVDVEDVDVSRLNRRREQRGKPRIQEHRTVRLHMDIRRRERMARQGLSKAEIQQHLVCGHPKVRKTGVFWWRPFLRGHGGGPAKTPQYQIKGDLT